MNLFEQQNHQIERGYSELEERYAGLQGTAVKNTETLSAPEV